ncbi:MAG: hypothetical protein PHD74_00600 [Candidatus Krumholzibacteria bacterium]|nr:hypothetical protein [Candidatus Krumholzibacteria bacterium]
MFKGKVVAFALMLVLATSIYAGTVDDCTSEAGISGCTTMQMAICPAGDFETFSEACGGTGAYVWIIARDASSNPIPGIPWTDYWMNACDPDAQLCLCANPVNADSLTGDNGRTTFTARVIRGGGCVLEDGIWWAIQGKPIKTAESDCEDNLCLSIIIKGPDLTGNTTTGGPDCLVTLPDLIPFGISFNKTYPNASFNACCDYTDDNSVNLSDFAYFGVHWQHKCQ